MVLKNIKSVSVFKEKYIAGRNNLDFNVAAPTDMSNTLTIFLIYGDDEGSILYYELPKKKWRERIM